MLEPNVLLIKPVSGVFLKSEKTRAYFNRKLRENIKCALHRNKIEFNELRQGRMRFYLYADELEKCLAVLKRVFGLHSLALAYEFEFTDLDEIAEKAAKFFARRFEKNESFAVECSRTGMHYFSSQEVERKVGARIVKNFGLKVDLKKPDRVLHIEVRNEQVYLYADEIKCFGGLPTGVEGNVALFFSGKDEELVAGWLMLKRGCNVFPIVEKESKELEGAIKPLIMWNCYRKFALTPVSELKKLIKERDIMAIVKADTETTKEAFAKYKEFDSKQMLAVFRPLLFYDEAKLKGLIKIIKS